MFFTQNLQYLLKEDDFYVMLVPLYEIFINIRVNAVAMEPSCFLESGRFLGRFCRFLEDFIIFAITKKYTEQVIETWCVCMPIDNDNSLAICLHKQACLLEAVADKL